MVIFRIDEFHEHSEEHWVASWLGFVVYFDMEKEVDLQPFFQKEHFDKAWI